MPKALVTGASGFIGSTLIEELSHRGYEVYALLRKTSDVSNLKNAKFRRVEGDLSDLDSLKKAVIGMDYVFHLAGVVTAPSREVFVEHNARGTERLMEAVAQVNPSLRRFVLVSSLAAAGPSPSLEAPRTEKQPEAPVSDYGFSKYQGERLALNYKDRVRLTIIRPPMVYGPRDKGVFVVIQTVSRRLMPLIRGRTPDGNKYYSLIHVADLCRGIALAAEAPIESAPSGEIYYLTDGEIYSYHELLKQMARALEKRAFSFRISPVIVTFLAYLASFAGRILGKTFPLNIDKLNEIRPDFWTCSSQKASRELGYKPTLKLEAGMSNAIQWYRKQKWL